MPLSSFSFGKQIQGVGLTSVPLLSANSCWHKHNGKGGFDDCPQNIRTRHTFEGTSLYW
jgi:hypothetical protein